MNTVKNFVKMTNVGAFTATTTAFTADYPVVGDVLVPADTPFNLVLWDATDYADPADDPNVEIVTCTGLVDNTGSSDYALTLTRGQEGRTAIASISGKTYLLALSATADLFKRLGGDEAVSSVPSTNPPVSGTVYQNTGRSTLIFYIPITYNPTATVAATCAVACGPTATPPIMFTNSEPAAITVGRIDTTSVLVPPGWYYSLTVTNASIGTATGTALN